MLASYAIKGDEISIRSSVSGPDSRIGTVETYLTKGQSFLGLSYDAFVQNANARGMGSIEISDDQTRAEFFKVKPQTVSATAL